MFHTELSAKSSWSSSVSSVQSLDHLDRWEDMTDNSADSLPVLPAGSHCEEFGHGQERPLFDAVHPALPLPTMVSSPPQGALRNDCGEAVVACDVPMKRLSHPWRLQREGAYTQHYTITTRKIVHSDGQQCSPFLPCPRLLWMAKSVKSVSNSSLPVQELSMQSVSLYVS